MIAFRVVVCLSVLAAAAATEVKQCSKASVENLSDKVQLSPCKKVPCVLKRGSNQFITIKFTPDKDMPRITNSVSAEILGVKLPFIGVNGESICDKLTLENGEKTECPVKAGTTYVYKDSFPVLSFYPAVSLNIHWGLLDTSEKDIICFEVPATIK